MDFPFPHNYTNETLENTALPGKKIQHSEQVIQIWLLCTDMVEIKKTSQGRHEVELGSMNRVHAIIHRSHEPGLEASSHSSTSTSAVPPKREAFHGVWSIQRAALHVFAESCIFSSELLGNVAYFHSLLNIPSIFPFQGHKAEISQCITWCFQGKRNMQKK